MSRKKQPHTLVSLFSGCGGLDLGFHYAGFRLLWANDIDPDACETYRQNIGDICQGDLLQVGYPRLAETPDVLAAGFPCQSFSNAGSRRGTHEKRGLLYLESIRAVEHFLPKIAVFENVRGLLSARHGKKLIVEEICERLGKLRYSTYFRLVDSSKYRVPQRRLRLLIVAVRSDVSPGEFAFPVEQPSTEGLTIGETLFDIPEDAPNQKELLALNPQAIQIGAMVPEGGSWKSIPYAKLPPRLKRVHDNIVRYRWPNFYRRFARHEVAGTVTAAFKPENAGVWHPVEKRVFSVREIARIQSFPDWFVFQGRSIKSKYQQIGNAVPPRLAYEMGLQISKVLRGKPLQGIRGFQPLQTFVKGGTPLRPADPGVSLTLA